MTRPELIRWANAPEQNENVVAAAVRELNETCVSFSLTVETLRADLRSAQAAIRNYDAECARLRKAALPQAPWESDEVPM